MLSFSDECHSTKCQNADSECDSATCQHTDFYSAGIILLNVIMLIAILLSGVMLNFIMLIALLLSVFSAKYHCANCQ